MTINADFPMVDFEDRKNSPIFTSMKKSVNNPHDKFVRETFSDPERARAFVEEFVPKEVVSHLDLPSLKVLKESYLDKELKEHFSDLIFEIGIKDQKRNNVSVVLLFEHKSSPDRNVLIQVGYYLFAHWLQQVRKGKKLKLIIPVIYYQGKQKWEAPTLVHLFKSYPDDLLNFAPHLEHIFIALNEIPDTQINTLRNNMLAAALGAQKLRFNSSSLMADFERIISLFPFTDANENFLELLVVYSFKVTNLSEKNIAESMENIPQPIKNKVMTTYDRIINKGIEKGIEKGVSKQRTEMILALFDDGIGIPQLAKAAKISEEEVLKILKKNSRKK